MTLTQPDSPSRPPGDEETSAGRGRAAVVVLPAEIDMTNSDGVQAELCGRLRAGDVIADLTSTTFCDSSGAVALLRASRQASFTGHGLRLAVQPAGAVARVLELTGFAAHLHLFACVNDAADARW
jgi:anti-anti-sigma factor